MTKPHNTRYICRTRRGIPDVIAGSAHKSPHRSAQKCTRGIVRKHSEVPEAVLNRRQFTFSGLAAAIAALLPLPVFAKMTAPKSLAALPSAVDRERLSDIVNRITPADSPIYSMITKPGAVPMRNDDQAQEWVADLVEWSSR